MIFPPLLGLPPFSVSSFPQASDVQTGWRKQQYYGDYLRRPEYRRFWAGIHFVVWALVRAEIMKLRGEGFQEGRSDPL